MNNTLNASAFAPAKQFCFNELENIIAKIVKCYNLMIQNKVKLPNNENKIRDELLLKYLRNNTVRDRYALTDYNFDREVPEDHSIGRTDIKVTTIDTFMTQEAYYILECKRLNNVNKKGISGLNAEYIKNGINRFVKGYYSSYHSANAMIGFVVEKLDIDSNILDLNHLLTSSFTYINTIQAITKENFINNFPYHYSSRHITSKGSKNLKLYHLMLDFSKNII